MFVDHVKLRTVRTYVVLFRRSSRQTLTKAPVLFRTDDIASSRQPSSTPHDRKFCKLIFTLYSGKTHIIDQYLASNMEVTEMTTIRMKTFGVSAI